MNRILVVEDNPLNMQLVTDLLDAAGYNVLQAVTAEAGVDIARSVVPDLILMDLRLPGMDGYAALRALRADVRTAMIPTAALTAQAMDGDARAAIDAGFDAYITKPINTRKFAQEVEQLVRGGAER